MITRIPLSRIDLKIKKKDHVLEVGSGHNPSFRSNILVDKYIDDNSNRCDNLFIYPHQKFINASGESLPFKDKEFDYVIANQVLEHAEDPAAFISELCRVSKRGYIETPSLIGEFLFPKQSHKWVILFIDNKLIFYDKKKMKGN
jgi:ubiquinone/menaquinone biosynthesis C-methylase UbiE